MQLISGRGSGRPGLLFAFTALFACSATSFAVDAHADGEVSIRGFYFKERSTRVQQPAMSSRFDVGDDGEARVNLLVDAITSASTASGASGQPFTEVRWQTGGSYVQQFGRFRLGGTTRYSNEPDYKSAFGGVRGEVDLAQKNTVLGIAFNVGSDDINNAGAQGGIGQPIEGTLSTYMGSLSVTQLLSPTLVAGVTYDVAYLDGFQENPYRSVVAGGAVVREEVPETRLRQAAFASLRGYIPASKTTIFGGYRFYFDDWGLRAHTPELRVTQELPRAVSIGLNYRYYTQTATDFFKFIYDSNDPAVEPFVTDDPKLSPFDGQTFGTRLNMPLSALGVLGEQGKIVASAAIDYVIQNNRYGDAIILQFGLTVPFAY